MDDRPEVNGLPLPPRLVSMIATGRWRHPGDDVLKALIPYLDGPLDFLPIVSMRRESRFTFLENPGDSASFRILRGSKTGIPVELPWLDADKAVFIAVCRFSGDDLAIALDYRTRLDDPWVLAGEWLPGPAGCIWREVADTFSEFARLLGLDA
jgi:hypothetical protein